MAHLTEEEKSRRMTKEKEELWFPEFGLKDNPFQYTDYNSESTANLPLIVTEEVGRIKIITGKVFIVGGRGVGKSTVLWLAKQDLLKPGERIIVSIISSPNVTTFYNDLFLELHSVYQAKEKGEDFLKKNVGFDCFNCKTDEEFFECVYPRCKLRKKCTIPILIEGQKPWEPSPLEGEEEHFHPQKKMFDFDLLLTHFAGFDKYCPLRVELVQKLLKNLPNYGVSKCKFLLDIPDDMYKGIDTFKETIRHMERVGDTIIMANKEQYNRLAKSDYFSRAREFPFLRMTNEELKQLLYKRIEWKQIDGNFPPLFTDEAINYVVMRSIRNPRMMLKICDEVLIEMHRCNKTDSADVSFVQEHSETSGRLTVDDCVEMLVEHYVTSRRRWVSVKESVKDLERLYNVSISDVALGRKLLNLHKQKKIADHALKPDSHYLYYTGKVEEG